MSKIRSLVGSKPALMNFVAFVYNLLHYNNSWKYRRHNSFNFKGAFLRKCRFEIRGRNNTVTIGPKARLQNCTFTFLGSNCNIVIGGGNTILFDVHFWCEDDASSIYIGNHFLFWGGHMAATEGKDITVGNNTGFSRRVEVRNGDSHPIINTITKERINHAKPVIIGDHVWVATDAKIFKGAVVPSNTIIGNSTIVTSVLEKENALYVGMPARLVKENIEWKLQKEY